MYLPIGLIDVNIFLRILFVKSVVVHETTIMKINIIIVDI